MTISIVKCNAGNDDGLNFARLAVRLVQLVGDQLHLLGHGEHPLGHGAGAQTLVQLLLDAAEIIFS